MQTTITQPKRFGVTFNGGRNVSVTVFHLLNYKKIDIMKWSRLSRTAKHLILSDYISRYCINDLPKHQVLIDGFVILA
jgi:hypothetical protein